MSIRSMAKGERSSRSTRCSCFAMCAEPIARSRIGTNSPIAGAFTAAMAFLSRSKLDAKVNSSTGISTSTRREQNAAESRRRTPKPVTHVPSRSLCLL